MAFAASGQSVSAPKVSLVASLQSAYSLESVRSLFDPGNGAFLTACAPASRLVIATDGSVAGRRYSLERGLGAWEAEGALLDHLHAVVDRPDLTELEASLAISRLAADWRLGRRDRFVAFGGSRLRRVVGLAATMFRRHTASLTILPDLPAVLESLRQGNRVDVADGPIAVTPRETHALVDEDGLVAAGSLRSEEVPVLLLAALLDERLLERVAGSDDVVEPEVASRLRSEVLGVVLRFYRRFGPAHAVWQIGRAWEPLVARGDDPPAAYAGSLLLAAWVAQRLGLLESAAAGRLEAAARRLGVASLPSPALVEQALDGAWPGAGEAGQRPVALPTSSANGNVVTLDGQSLAGRSAKIRLRPIPNPSARAGRLSYGLRFVDGVFDPENDSLAALLPVGGRVLAVIDDYPGAPVASVERYLEEQGRGGRLAAFTVQRVSSSPAVKNTDAIARLLDIAEAARLSSGDRIVVMGGGTVMDMVGHAAFLYRGDTPYVRVPTTLVGMIDAGIGLKVGVNLGERKNLLGAYHTPLACLCDVRFLSTLPIEEIRCGLSEAIKMAVVRDARLFELIETHRDELLQGTPTPHLHDVLLRSVSAMLHELESNPFEQDLRRLPDFGHEFGQVIESLSAYRLRHGEAVSIGMAISCRIAVSTGHLRADVLDRILSLLLAIGLPIYDPTCEAEVLWRKLREEVLPHKGGTLHLVVPTEIGRGAFVHSLDDISPALVVQAWKDLRYRSQARRAG